MTGVNPITSYKCCFQSFPPFPVSRFQRTSHTVVMTTARAYHSAPLQQFKRLSRKGALLLEQEVQALPPSSEQLGVGCNVVLWVLLAVGPVSKCAAARAWPVPRGTSLITIFAFVCLCDLAPICYRCFGAQTRPTLPSPVIVPHDEGFYLIIHVVL